MLTELAIQLKSLSFLIGLGGFFSITKSTITGFILLHGVGENTRASIKSQIKCVKLQILGVAAIMAALFILALCLYFGPLGELDVEALKAGTSSLTQAHGLSIVVLIIIALVFIVLDVIVTIKQREIRTIADQN